VACIFVVILYCDITEIECLIINFFRVMSKEKPNWKRIIEFVIVILTTIASFIGGNVSAQNGYRLVDYVSISK
jgi:hypothetical protein